MGIQTAPAGTKDQAPARPHPNAELAMKGYRAFARGDIDELTSLFTEDVAWLCPGRNLLSGTYQGKQGVREFIRKLWELSGGTFRVEFGEGDLLANDRQVVVTARHRAERGGRSFSEPFVHVMEIRDGKVSRFQPYAADQHAVDEFWS